MIWKKKLCKLNPYIYGRLWSWHRSVSTYGPSRSRRWFKIEIKVKLKLNENYMKIKIKFENIYQTKSTTVKTSNLTELKETQLALNVFLTLLITETYLKCYLFCLWLISTTIERPRNNFVLFSVKEIVEFLYLLYLQKEWIEEFDFLHVHKL